MTTEISGDERCSLEKIQVDVDVLNEMKGKHGNSQLAKNGRMKENVGSLPQILALSGKGNKTMRP